MQTWEPEMQTARFQTKRPSCLHWLHWEEKKKKEKTKTQKKQNKPEHKKTTPKNTEPQASGILLKIKKHFLTEEERGEWNAKPSSFITWD